MPRRTRYDSAALLKQALANPDIAKRNPALVADQNAPTTTRNCEKKQTPIKNPILRDNLSIYTGNAIAEKPPAPADLKRLRFVLQTALPTMNAYMRWHWSRRKKFKEKLALEIYYALRFCDFKDPNRPMGLPGWRYAPLERVSIYVMRVQPAGRPLDYDAKYSPLKFLLDALQGPPQHPGGIGIIKDDNKKIIKYLSCRTFTGKTKTVVIVKPLKLIT